MSQIPGLPVNNTPAGDDDFPHEDTSAGTTKRMTLSKIMEFMNPVGTLYFNADDDTNPADKFGFGTWVPYAAGRVPVGVDTSDTDFDVGGKESGDKEHFHWQTTGCDPTGAYGEVDGAGSGHTRVIVADRVSWSAGARATDNTRGDGTYDSSSLQPSVAVYIWKRTD